jgi:predicted DNA-binding protein with PD1-like motif
MTLLPIRLSPGQDLRVAIEEAVCSERADAAFALSGIGSLAPAFIRLAGGREAQLVDGDVELLALCGTIARKGRSHLHAVLADAQGRVVGGHIGRGCIVRTTVEALLLLLPEWSFTREFDPLTGFDELVIDRKVARRDP